ncbi:hypothetical protein HOO65_080452 [Ceratocystis lukuohia]|uniref:Uncharacterized protein n=1 Tax=Ceratocystis lukuohia TaxID=2019550 RepID=A0ABR4MB61_9PEZI
MSVSYQQPPSLGQDDLVALFSRTLTLNPNMAAQLAASMENPAMPLALPTTFASQHYIHSTTSAATDAAAAARPPRHHMSNDARLRAYGIDPNSLSPSQMQLFRIADSAQQSRLLDLWKIFPPSLPGEDPSHAWTPTNLETEEHRAIARFAKLVGQEQEKEQEPQTETGEPSGHMDEDMAVEIESSPIDCDYAAQQQADQLRQQQQAAQAAQMSAGYPVQSPSGAWLRSTDTSASNDPFADDGCGGSCAPEPYMASGYEELMRREAKREEHLRRMAQEEEMHQMQIEMLRQQEQEIEMERMLAEQFEMEQLQELERQNQERQLQQNRSSTGSLDGSMYVTFGSSSTQPAITYRPAAYDRVYDNSLVGTPRDLQRMDMMQHSQQHQLCHSMGDAMDTL